MIYLVKKTLQLDDQDDHLATDWQVSRTLAFNDIVAESMADYTNKNAILFDDVLDPNIKYYARARALIQGKGYTTWGNLTVFKSVALNTLVDNEDLPTKVGTPILTTNSHSDGSHDATLFKITASGFSVVGSGDHESTSWFITDVNNEVIWSRTNDTINKTELTVSGIILKDSSLYRLNAIFHCTTGDSSSIGVKTIVVDDGGHIVVRTSLNGFNYTTATGFYVTSEKGYSGHFYEILNITETGVISIWSASATTGVTIPANTVKANESYVMRIRDNSSDRAYKHVPFTTY